jgi:hypothetical protein
MKSKTITFKKPYNHYDKKYEPWFDGPGYASLCKAGVRKLLDIPNTAKKLHVTFLERSVNPNAIKLHVTMYGKVHLDGKARGLTIASNQLAKELYYKGYRYIVVSYEE